MVNDDHDVSDVMKKGRIFCPPICVGPFEKINGDHGVPMTT